MKKYMVTVTFLKRPDKEIVELMPAEQEHLTELMRSGLLETVNVKSDWSCAWYLMNAASEYDVREALSTSPIAKHFEAQIDEVLK